MIPTTKPSTIVGLNTGLSTRTHDGKEDVDGKSPIDADGKGGAGHRGPAARTDFSATTLTAVRPFGIYSTPVAIFHVDGEEQAALNKGIAAVAIDAAKGVYGPHGGFGGHPQRWTEHGVFQTGRELLFGSLRQHPAALRDLRALIYRSIQKYVSSAPTQRGAGCDNVFTAGPSAPCNVGRDERDAVNHMRLEITSAWINKLNAADPRARAESIYSSPHEHMGWGTGISGVYYAQMGWASRNGSAVEDGSFIADPSAFLKQSTKFNVMKPIQFAGLGDDNGGSPFEAIDPTPGTLLLFPSWLRHSAELHTGDEHRIVVAFNVEIDLGRSDDGGGGTRPVAGGRAGRTELPVFVPKAHCSASLC